MFGWTIDGDAEMMGGHSQIDLSMETAGGRVEPRFVASLLPFD